MQYDKINPFIEKFKQDLETGKKKIDRQMAAKGNYHSGARFVEIENFFLGLLENLVKKIKKIIYKDIENGKMDKPAFSEIKSMIVQSTDTIVENFKIDMKGQKMSKAFNEVKFEQTKENLFERLFVDMEQELDGI